MGRVKGNVDLKWKCQKAQYSQWIYARHQRRQEMMPDREKWEWRCTFKKKREKGGKCLLVRTEITQTKSLNALKQDHMHFVTSVVILYTPQPPPYVFFLLPLPPSNMATLSVVLWIYNVGEVMLHWYQITATNQPNYTGCTTDYLQDGWNEINAICLSLRTTIISTSACAFFKNMWKKSDLEEWTWSWNESSHSLDVHI